MNSTVTAVLKIAKIANMAKPISATDAKNNFGGMLEDVLEYGRVNIVKHGRVVAVVLTPRELAALEARQPPSAQAEPAGRWGRTHMVPPHLARRAKVVRKSIGFDHD
jgi:prevent-host-death family protein